MADGGASSFIMLITALLISGAASIVLVEAWSGTADTIGKQRDKNIIDSDTDIGIAGDPGAVKYDTGATPDEITFYIQNTGNNILDETSLGIWVDGISVTASIVDTFVGAGVTEWAPGELVEVIVDDSSWAYTTGTEVTISVVVNSEVSNGVKGTASFNELVRLRT